MKNSHTFNAKTGKGFFPAQENTKKNTLPANTFILWKNLFFLTILITSLSILPLNGQNLLQNNPSFEGDDASSGNGGYSFPGWEGNNYRWNSHNTVNSGAPGAGKKAFTMSHGGFLQTSSGSLAEVTGGESYLLTFQCQKPLDDKPWQWLGLLPSIVFFDKDGTEIKTVWGQEVLSQGPGTWRVVRLVGAAPPEAVKARVRVEFNAGSYPDEDGRSFDLDDFTLTHYQDAMSLGFRRAALDIEPGRNAEVILKYRAPEKSDLVLRLLRAGQTVSESKVTGVQGRGLATLQVPIPTSAMPGNDYSWNARLTKTGGSWETAQKAVAQEGISLDLQPKTDSKIQADNPQLIYEGRWLKDKANHPRALWQGSTLHARFTGTRFAMKYSYNSWDVNHRLRLRLLVDGVDRTPQDALALSQGTEQVAELVSGLSPGIHTIAVIRDGEEATTLWEMIGVELDANAGLLTYRPFMNRRLEFYGDSTSSGGDGGMAVNFTKTTARALAAECSVVSKGATGVSGGFVFKYNALYYWDRFDFNVFFGSMQGDPPGDSHVPRNPYTANPQPDPQQTRGEPWGPGNFEAYGDPASFAEITAKGRFATWQPDGVVISYGQNDQFGGGPFVSNYRQFVTLLRKVYPQAHIFMTHSNMTGSDGFLQSAMEPILQDTGPGGLNSDGKIHMMIVTPRGNTNGNHPSAQNHQELALGNKDWRGAVDWIEDTLGWSGTAVSDPIETTAPAASPPLDP